MVNLYHDKAKDINVIGQHILDSANVGIIAIDIDGKIIFINKEAQIMLSLSNKKVMGEFITDVMPNSDLFGVIHSRKPQVGVKVQVGEKLFYSHRSPMVCQDSIIGAIAVFVDITDKKSFVVQLSEAAKTIEMLEQILDNIDDPIVFIDKNGIIKWVNQPYEAMIKKSKKELLGEKINDVVESTRMHKIVESGEEEIAQVQNIKGKNMLVMRVPIIKRAEIVGAVGKVMFRDICELEALASKFNRINTELSYYKKELQRHNKARYTFNNIIGESKTIKDTINIAKEVAKTNSTILITGGSGTGKELFAQAIHNHSLYRYGPFIRVNCAAIPTSLFESELFGYESGAFSGALKGGKPGKFEIAHNGTIFLDEIGEMPLEMQVKLLRVIQEREVERIGGSSVIPINVRIIAATNKDIENMIIAGSFRNDLYYRLNIIRIDLPPLNTMKSDMQVFVKKILQRLNRELGTNVEKITPEVMEVFLKHSWPGNIRELKNALERCLATTRDKTITAEHLPPYLLENNDSVQDVVSLNELGRHHKLDEILKSTEKKAIMHALRLTGGNKQKSAKLLGIHRSALYQKLKKHQLI